MALDCNVDMDFKLVSSSCLGAAVAVITFLSWFPIVLCIQDYAKELAYLKEKVDAGADFLVTQVRALIWLWSARGVPLNCMHSLYAQMFFDVPLYFKFVSDCRAIGITAPIVPGIMLIQSFAGFKRMTAFCKSRVPADLLARLEAVKVRACVWLPLLRS